MKPNTEEDYKNLYRLLQKENAQFHTFELKSEKPLKVVLREVLTEITIDQVEQDLKQKTTSIPNNQNAGNPLVLIEISKEYKSAYNLTNYC